MDGHRTTFRSMRNLLFSIRIRLAILEEPLRTFARAEELQADTSIRLDLTTSAYYGVTQRDEQSHARAFWKWFEDKRVELPPE